MNRFKFLNLTLSNLYNISLVFIFKFLPKITPLISKEM